MPAFDLKPTQEIIRAGTHPSYLHFTASRYAVPEFLQAHVDNQTWARTFDKVVERCEFALRSVQPWWFNPWCLLFSLAKIKATRQEHENAWRSLVEEEHELYWKLGVAVSLALEPCSAFCGGLVKSNGRCSCGSTRQCKVVGLRFRLIEGSSHCPTIGYDDSDSLSAF